MNLEVLQIIWNQNASLYKDWIFANMLLFNMLFHLNNKDKGGHFLAYFGRNPVSQMLLLSHAVLNESI